MQDANQKNERKGEISKKVIFKISVSNDCKIFNIFIVIS